MSDTCPKCGAEMTIYIDDVHPQPAHTTDSTECQLNQASARIAKLEQMILPLEEAVCGRDVEIERLRAENEKLRAICEDWTDWRPGVGIIAHQKPGHGSCCTCQTCGRSHDDCVCEHNEIEKAMQAAEAAEGDNDSEPRNPD